MSAGVLYVPRGLPASGKSTWARAMVDSRCAGDVARLNRDDLRAMMLSAHYRVPVHAAEEVVTAVQQGPIVDLLRRGVDVIVDDMNLRIKYVRNLVALAARAGAQHEVVDKFLDVPLEECIRRDAARPRPVGEDVIRGMHTRFLSGGRRLPAPTLDPAEVTGKPYVPVPGTPRAVMVDIDGTVALMGDRRGPYDTSRYHLDEPNPAVIEAVQMAADCGLQVVFCSGRSEEFYDVTERWIAEHVLDRSFEWELWMRPAGDTRNDAVVKLELFDEHIRNRYDVRAVYDDRDRVVAAWRSIGLTVFQVADGAF